MIVSGACGVGKSAALLSIHEEVSARGGESAVLESDQFYMMIDPRWTMPSARVGRYFEVAGWLLRETALGFLRSGFDCVVIASNGLWAEAHVRRFVAPFFRAGAGVHHVTLDPGVDVACERLARCDKRPHWFGDAEQLRVTCAEEVLKVRAHTGAWTHVVDNSLLTPAETASAILDAVECGEGALLAQE